MVFLEKGFTHGKIDTTLFLMFDGKDMLIVQIYVDDIIFDSTNKNLCKDFSKIMQDEFEISMMTELNFFLGLQIKQTKGGIFLNQSKYICQKPTKKIWIEKCQSNWNSHESFNKA